MSNTPVVEKRSPGRPASFPNQATKAFLTTIPVETADAVRALAKEREENLNVMVNTLLERGLRATKRNAS